MIFPWVNLAGFFVGTFVWSVGLMSGRRSWRFLGIGLTVSSAVFFAMMCVALASVR